MALLMPVASSAARPYFPSSFRRWQRTSMVAGSLPIIGVAGSRGKSTVIRLLDAIFTAAGLRTVVWTDHGVEIVGRRQPSELAGWTRALNDLADGEVDVALQELDWATVNAVGLPAGTYPIIAITNVCGNSDTCLADGQAQQALRALPTIKRAVHPDGALILNGDDYHVLTEDEPVAAEQLVTAISASAPAIRTRRQLGESGLWLQETSVVLGAGDEEVVPIVDLMDVPLALAGDATFETSNILVAVATALSSGLGGDEIQRGIRDFAATPLLLPGSFNVHHMADARVFVDRINPPWFLRPVLRAVNPGGRSPLVTVIGSLDRFSDDHAYEIGRLLGRYRGAVIYHSTESALRLDAFRRGLTTNPVPPLMFRLPTERRALNRGLKALKPGTPLLVLTNDCERVNRLVGRVAARVS